MVPRELVRFWLRLQLLFVNNPGGEAVVVPLRKKIEQETSKPCHKLEYLTLLNTFWNAK